MSKGWIKLYRKIEDNVLWQDKPFSKGQAWIDILLDVNHCKNEVLIGNKIEEVNPGEKITSIRKLCDRWGWSNTKVKSFLDLLKKQRMIEYKSDTKKTVIKVLNYGDYQHGNIEENDTKTPQKHIKNTSKTHQKHTNKNVKNVKNDKEEVTISDNEKVILNTIKSVKLYPFDYEKDLDFFRELTVDFPDVDIVKQIKKWKTYKLDNPLKKNSNARSQIRNWMTNASKWSKKEINKKNDHADKLRKQTMEAARRGAT